MIKNEILKKQLDFVSHPKIHGKQKDIAKQPYIYHLLRVRMFAAKLIRTLLANEKISKQDNDSFINNILETAMLHDVLEDCDLSNNPTNEIKEYCENIPNNVMKAMQCLNKNNYSNKEEYINHIIDIKLPYTDINMSLNNQSSPIEQNILHNNDIVSYIVLIVKMADTLDNMNIFRLTNSIDTFNKMFPNYIQNYSLSVLNKNKDENKLILAFEEFKNFSNDKKMDFIINQLIHEYKNENSFVIKTINRLNNYWDNWKKYTDCYQFVFNKHKKIIENNQKKLNINDLLNSIKVQYGLLNINLYDIEKLNQTAQQLFWIENDIDSDEYYNIQKQINYIPKKNRKLKRSI